VNQENIDDNSKFVLLSWCSCTIIQFLRFTSALEKLHSRTNTSVPLLDQVSLASILVLLSTDDPNISTLRLYRVTHNFCFLIMRWNEESMEHYFEPSTVKLNQREDDKVKWLKLRLDSALGGCENVFLKNEVSVKNPTCTCRWF
jgi:hypothetical protein